MERWLLVIGLLRLAVAGMGRERGVAGLLMKGRRMMARVVLREEGLLVILLLLRWWWASELRRREVVGSSTVLRVLLLRLRIGRVPISILGGVREEAALAVRRVMLGIATLRRVPPLIAGWQRSSAVTRSSNSDTVRRLALLMPRRPRPRVLRIGRVDAVDRVH